jgi:ribosome-binding factor A
MNERRIARIEDLIKRRVAEVVGTELNDPRRGLITITRVKVDKELATCTVFWSVLGDDTERRLNENMLEHATRFVQREVATVLHTRTVPRLRFVFDESIAGAIRVQGLLDELRREREAKGLDGAEPPADDPPQDA